MKIFSPKGFIPLVVSGMVVNGTPQEHTFRYNEIMENKTQTMENSTREYLKVSEGSYANLLREIQFKQYLKAWKEETQFVSSPTEIVGNENFQGIVNLGKPVVPLVLSELQNNPNYLVWALNFIYKTKVSDSEKTTIPEAAKLWIQKISLGEIA